MAIITLNNRAINRSDTAASGQLWTATSATASDFQAVSAGKIGQVVQTLKTDTEQSTSTSFVSADFAVTITPTATSSKILLLVTFGSLNTQNGGQYTHVKIDGGNCATYIGGAATGYETAMTTIGTKDSTGQQGGLSLMYLDSPSTTSSTTYTVHWHMGDGSGNINLNRVYSLLAAAGNTASTFTAMEVLA